MQGYSLIIWFQKAVYQGFLEHKSLLFEGYEVGGQQKSIGHGAKYQNAKKA